MILCLFIAIGDIIHSQLSFWFSHLHSTSIFNDIASIDLLYTKDKATLKIFSFDHLI